MEFLAALWLPILLSAVFVFVASSLIHMVLKYHANDFKKVPDQDAVQAALRQFNIPVGDYMLPRCDSMKDMKNPEFQEKLKKGPVAMVTVIKMGNMGTSFVLWFLYSIVVGVFAAYIGWHAVQGQPGHTYLSVFRFVGCSAFMGYSLALLQGGIWYGRQWGTILKTVFDGLIYALLTAGVFGWLWPKV